MSSWQTKALAVLLRATVRPVRSTRERGLRALTRAKPPAAPPRRLRARVSRRVVRTPAPVPVDRVRPSDGAVGATGAAASDGVLLYFHGGSFIDGIARLHWDLVADLADATGLPVDVPHYGKAPEHTADDAHALMDALLGQTPATRIHLAGDSAGGNLALLTAQRHRGDERIGGITLISPALDLSMENPQIGQVEPTDPWLTRAGVRPLLEAWAGERELTDPQVSPVHGDLSGLPPIHVFIGTRDICWPDVEVLERRAREAGTPITVHATEGSPHVHVLLPTPEGRGDRATLLGVVAQSTQV